MNDMIGLFAHDEGGAVTADMVVVTAGAIAVALAVMATVGDGILDTSDAVNTEMESKANISYTVRSD